MLQYPAFFWSSPANHGPQTRIKAWPSFRNWDMMSACKKPQNKSVHKKSGHNQDTHSAADVC